MKIIPLSKYRNLTGESPNAVKHRFERGTSVVGLQVLNINLYLDRKFNDRYSHTEPFTPSKIVQLNWNHTNFELEALNANSRADNFQPKGTKTNTPALHTIRG